MNSANDQLNMGAAVVVEAIQNDAQLKELYKRLAELHSRVVPQVIQVSTTEHKIIYSDEFNELITKFHQEIDFRKEQIMSFYNR